MVKGAVLTFKILLHISRRDDTFPTCYDFALPNNVRSIMRLERINATRPGLENNGLFADEGSVCTADSVFQLSVQDHLPNLIQTSILPFDARHGLAKEARY